MATHQIVVKIFHSEALMSTSKIRGSPKSGGLIFWGPDMFKIFFIVEQLEYFFTQMVEDFGNTFTTVSILSNDLLGFSKIARHLMFWKKTDA